MNQPGPGLLPAGEDPARARRAFVWTFVVTLLLKIWLAAYFPMTGDEVYFYQWGVHPDFGYYDHPPMVGWMLYALNGISSHPLPLRIVTVLSWSLVALGMVDLMRRMVPDQQATAYWLGTLFLALPFAWALNIVTTDTPLILFVFASGYCFIRASPVRPVVLVCRQRRISGTRTAVEIFRRVAGDRLFRLSRTQPPRLADPAGDCRVRIAVRCAQRSLQCDALLEQRDVQPPEPQ